jgi:hypothetical protein
MPHLTSAASTAIKEEEEAMLLLHFFPAQISDYVEALKINELKRRRRREPNQCERIGRNFAIGETLFELLYQKGLIYNTFYTKASKIYSKQKSILKKGSIPTC